MSSGWWRPPPSRSPHRRPRRRTQPAEHDDRGGSPTTPHSARRAATGSPYGAQDGLAHTIRPTPAGRRHRVRAGHRPGRGRAGSRNPGGDVTGDQTGRDTRRRRGGLSGGRCWSRCSPPSRWPKYPPIATCCPGRSPRAGSLDEAEGGAGRPALGDDIGGRVADEPAVGVIRRPAARTQKRPPGWSAASRSSHSWHCFM